MAKLIKILAISGSTRKESSNLNLIKAIAILTSGIFELAVFEGLSSLPHFNPDFDNEHAPHEIAQFRNQLRAADGILICTPEYALGVPGSLKNAIDWTVSSMEFSKKPVALITASLSGEKAHDSLLGTLLMVEAHLTAETHLLIPYIKTKVTKDFKITDAATLESVNKLWNSLLGLIKDENIALLSPVLLTSKV